MCCDQRAGGAEADTLLPHLCCYARPGQVHPGQSQVQLAQKARSFSVWWNAHVAAVFSISASLRVVWGALLAVNSSIASADDTRGEVYSNADALSQGSA